MSKYLLEVIPEWRPGRARWWRANAAGYTNELTSAGIYTEEQAIRHSKGSDRTNMVSLEDVQGELNAEIERLEGEIDELKKKVEHLRSVGASDAE